MKKNNSTIWENMFRKHRRRQTDLVSNILNNNNSINLIRPKVTRLENSNFLNDERDKKAGQNNRNNWDMLQKGLQKEKNAIRNAMKNINKIEQKMKKQKRSKQEANKGEKNWKKGSTLQNFYVPRKLGEFFVSPRRGSRRKTHTRPEYQKKSQKNISTKGKIIVKKDGKRQKKKHKRKTIENFIMKNKKTVMKTSKNYMKQLKNLNKNLKKKSKKKMPEMFFEKNKDLLSKTMKSIFESKRNIRSQGTGHAKNKSCVISGKMDFRTLKMKLKRKTTSNERNSEGFSRAYEIQNPVVCKDNFRTQNPYDIRMTQFLDFKDERRKDEFKFEKPKRHTTNKEENFQKTRITPDNFPKLLGLSQDQLHNQNLAKYSDLHPKLIDFINQIKKQEKNANRFPSVICKKRISFSTENMESTGIQETGTCDPMKCIKESEICKEKEKQIDTFEVSKCLLFSHEKEDKQKSFNLHPFVGRKESGKDKREMFESNTRIDSKQESPFVDSQDLTLNLKKPSRSSQKLLEIRKIIAKGNQKRVVSSAISHILSFSDHPDFQRKKVDNLSLSGCSIHSLANHASLLKNKVYLDEFRKISLSQKSSLEINQSKYSKSVDTVKLKNSELISLDSESQKRLTRIQKDFFQSSKYKQLQSSLIEWKKTELIQNLESYRQSEEQSGQKVESEAFSGGIQTEEDSETDQRRFFINRNQFSETKGRNNFKVKSNEEKKNYIKEIFLESNLLANTRSDPDNCIAHESNTFVSDPLIGPLLDDSGDSPDQQESIMRHLGSCAKINLETEFYFDSNQSFKSISKVDSSGEGKRQQNSQNLMEQETGRTTRSVNVFKEESSKILESFRQSYLSNLSIEAKTDSLEKCQDDNLQEGDQKESEKTKNISKSGFFIKQRPRSFQFNQLLDKKKDSEDDFEMYSIYDDRQSSECAGEGDSGTSEHSANLS